LASTRVMKMHLVGIAIAELEQEPPWTVDVDRPEAAQVALQFVETHRVQRAEVGQRPRRVELRQPSSRQSLVHSREFAGATQGKSHRPRIPEGPDHASRVMPNGHYVKRMVIPLLRARSQENARPEVHPRAGHDRWEMQGDLWSAFRPTKSQAAFCFARRLRPQAAKPATAAPNIGSAAGSGTGETWLTLQLLSPSSPRTVAPITSDNPNWLMS